MLSRHLNTGRPSADALVPLNRGTFSRDFNRLTRPLPHCRKAALRFAQGPLASLRVRSLRSPAYAISVGPPGRTIWCPINGPKAAWRVAPWCLLSDRGRGPPGGDVVAPPILAPLGGAAAIHLDPGLVPLLTSVQSWRWFTDDTRTGTVRRHPMLSRAKSGVRPSQIGRAHV